MRTTIVMVVGRVFGRLKPLQHRFCSSTSIPKICQNLRPCFSASSHAGLKFMVEGTGRVIVLQFDGYEQSSRSCVSTILHDLT